CWMDLDGTAHGGTGGGEAHVGGVGVDPLALWRVLGHLLAVALQGGARGLPGGVDGEVVWDGVVHAHSLSQVPPPTGPQRTSARRAARAGRALSEVKPYSETRSRRVLPALKCG